jgi:hypothetical protein
MNTVGWLGGGGAAPLVIGIVARDHGLSLSIALASVVYLAAGLLLLLAARIEKSERAEVSHA